MTSKRPSWGAFLVPLVLAFLGIAIFFWLGGDETSAFLWGLLWLFLGAQLLATLVDLLQGRARSPRAFLLLFLLYCLQTSLQLLLVFIIFPLIIVELILGPVAFGAAIVTFVGLGLYGLEEILHIDVKGMSWYGSDQQALLFVGIFVFSIAVMYGRFFILAERNIHEKLLDLIASGLEPLHSWQERVRQN